MTKEYRPELRYFLKSNLLILFLPWTLFYVYYYFFRQREMIPVYLILAISFFIWLFLVYQYLYIRKLSWRITPEQLIYTRGVISIDTDYLELYRINDFKEYSSVLDRLFLLKNIIISSTDYSHPEIAIRGISIQTDILTYLRKQVELMKQKHRIHEIANY